MNLISNSSKTTGIHLFGKWPLFMRCHVVKGRSVPRPLMTEHGLDLVQVHQLAIEIGSVDIKIQHTCKSSSAKLKGKPYCEEDLMNLTSYRTWSQHPIITMSPLEQLVGSVFYLWCACRCPLYSLAFNPGHYIFSKFL
ncbi:unnamed protein product [Allacma fusca]|uniref:Uncharacterized protein n=1 Tax=Allacma fusca TaxID=39272 RepID=A0A8J2PUL1_9HEXA|nr:unnamed protein product [Allacma fusca]